VSKVAVKPDLIRWARERSGVTTADLVQRFPKYEAWERGEDKPTLRQLENLAKKTLTPLGYFFLARPPEDHLPIPDFRAVADEPVKRPSPNLLETVQTMLRRQDWMRDFLTEEGQSSLPYIGSVTLQDRPQQTALRVRETLGMTSGWASQQRTWTEALLEFRRLVERAGVIVAINGVVGNNVYRKLDPEEFRGFVLSDPLAPLIFVNGADAKAAQMFTLAHEVAHLWIGRGGVFNLEGMQPANSEVEKFCNRLAAEVLIPERELPPAWAQAIQTAEPFQTMARRFKVSPLVTARRALDAGLIGRDEFFEFYTGYQQDERRQAAARTSGGDFYATQEVRVGRRFGEAVIRAAREGKLLYREAYQLTGLFGETFDRFAKGLGFIGG
jgi:Zn-dependent peptidase ImmA (M78 family)